jgi:hypothetical protein
LHAALQGFRAVWLNNGTKLTCVAAPDAPPAWVTPVTALLCIIGVLLLAGVALFVWLRMTVQLRPRWQREKELVENRKKGVPSGGPATIVVTDIERYSGGLPVDYAFPDRVVYCGCCAGVVLPIP